MVRHSSHTCPDYINFRIFLNFLSDGKTRDKLVQITLISEYSGFGLDGNIRVKRVLGTLIQGIS